MNHKPYQQLQGALRGELPSIRGCERLLAAKLHSLLLNHGWSSESIKRVLSSTQEAFLNAVEHGNGGQPELKVNYYAVLETGRLRVLITDSGCGRKPPGRPSLHLGWKVIEAFSQEACLYCDVATHRTTAQLSFSQNGLSEQEVI